MSPLALFAVGVGAAFGAWLRWLLSILLNAFVPALPPGTLAANLLGGLLMGAAMGLFAHYQNVAPEWQLLVKTGFLGGLTTFSTFSEEAITLLLRQQYSWFAAQIGTHVVGSLTATLIGLAVAGALLRA